MWVPEIWTHVFTLGQQVFFPLSWLLTLLICFLVGSVDSEVQSLVNKHFPVDLSSAPCFLSRCFSFDFTCLFSSFSFLIFLHLLSGRHISGKWCIFELYLLSSMGINAFFSLYIKDSG